MAARAPGLTRRGSDHRPYTEARDGSFGDWKPLGGSLRELRIDVGPGYRVYLATINHSTVVLLGGGSKSTQARDIARARATLRSIT